MVKIAEDKFCKKLPAEYINLLQIQNGGYTKGFGFPMSQRTSWSDSHIPLETLSGIVIDDKLDTALNILDTDKLINEWGLPSDQILLSGDGHYWITLDYRYGVDPVISWIDVECDQDLRIADSFKFFLQGLLPLSDFD